jgi:hypothetical protein
MKSLTALIILLMVSTSSFYPTVAAAQTTTIYQVNAPNSVVAGSQAPITVSVTILYNNTVIGTQLVVGVLDAGVSPQALVPGVVTSTTGTCINQAELAARCAISLTKSSGFEHIDFQLGGILGGKQEPGVWDLNITSVLIDQQNNLVPDSVSSKLFKIDLTPVELNVNVPSNVPVSVDGVLQPPGPASVGVALGPHVLAVPQFVNVTQSTRLRFDHWSDGNPSVNRTVDVTNGTTLQADYVTQNLLTLIGVQSNQTVSNWYDSDTNATFSTDQYGPMSGGLNALGLRLSLQGWYENGQLLTSSTTGTISMDKPHVLTAIWQVDYSIPAVIVVVAILAAALLAFLVVRRRKRRPTSHRRTKRTRRRS